VRAPWRVLLLAGISAIVLGLGKVHAVRNEYDFTGSARFGWSLSFILVLFVAAYAAGLPDLVRGWRAVLKATVPALGLSGLAVSIVQLIAGDALLPRFVVASAIALLVPWYVLCSSIASSRRFRGDRGDRLLFVGREPEAEQMRVDIGSDLERDAEMVDWLPLERARPTNVGGSPLVEAVAAGRVNLLVLSREAQADDGIVHQVAALHEEGVRVRTLSLFYEQWMGKLPITELERVSLLFDISELHRLQYLRLARLVDLMMSAIGAVALVPLMPVVVLANLLANRGPLFYRQLRVGKNGVEFSILKFRTMTPAGSHLPNEWTTADDPRITPFGRVLRRMHLDELPQIINILKGDLSVVGPRPEQPHYVEELVAKLPFYGLRHLVRPGLTGWAQVKFGYAGNERDAVEKLQYEFYYLRHQGLLLDLRIIVRTLRSVIGRRGR
jgi:lipopolysaccharide/colanic/teichoic acid biosynthesis glycosyltransferase